MSPGIVVGLVIVLTVVGLALRPLFRVGRQRVTQESTLPLENLLFQREALLAAIRDLQMDHAMGKLSGEHFAELDTRYRAQAVQILKQLDELGLEDAGAEDTETLLDDWIERAVADVRQGKGYLPSYPGGLEE